MARENQARPPLRDALGKLDTQRADVIIGTKQQAVADAQTGGNGVACDVEATLHVSHESANAFAFTGCDLSDEATPYIERTFFRAVGTTKVATVTLAQKINGNTSVTLDTAGSGVTLVPYQAADGTYSWVAKSAVGTVTYVP